MTVHPAKRQKPVEARIAAECNAWWDGEVVATSDDAAGLCRITCSPPRLQELCEWLEVEMGFTLATLVVEETPDSTLTLTYVLYPATTAPWVYVELSIDALNAIVPSLAGLTRGPSADWHEREAEDLFGLHFEGHPRLGEFVLHEDWPEGINPMRRSFDARQRFALREREPAWQPPTVLQAPGGFSMPVGPVFSDFAEAAHFLLETVGEEVIRTIPRFFYKFRGVEKIAEGQSVDRALLLAERFSGTSAFAHALAFSQAVETICEIAVQPRARALRTVFAELERLRHHAVTITSICNSTALAVATAQASLIEEDLLRLSAAVRRYRYLFALVEPGGVARDQSEEEVRHLATIVAGIAARLEDLHGMLRCSSSFLDRLEEVGMISAEEAISYGLVGPVARAAGFACDMRKLRPYAAYETMDFAIPVEPEGDGYARLRIFFREAALSAAMIDQILPRMPSGRSALTASSGVPAPRWARWRRRRAPLSIGCGSAKAARCSATASPLRLLPTGTPSISLWRTSRSKTSPSSLPALGCRTPSAIARRWCAMANRILKGLRAGIKSSAYPTRAESAAGVSPGRPAGTVLRSEDAADDLVARCPTDAIIRDGISRDGAIRRRGAGRRSAFWHAGADGAARCGLHRSWRPADLHDSGARPSRRAARPCKLHGRACAAFLQPDPAAAGKCSTGIPHRVP